MITLHGYFRSSSSYRCRIALNLKGVPYRQRPVHLLRGGGEQKRAKYAALNPQRLVPTLEADGHVLTQSPAILEWLEETFPEPPLLPADAIERAAVRSFCAAIACEIQPLQNLRVLQYLEADLGADAETRAAWLAHWVGEGLSACEAMLSGRRETRFAFSDTPGMAEVYLVPQIHAARRYEVDLSAMPRLCAIEAACAELPAFAAAHPAVQPDAA